MTESSAASRDRFPLFLGVACMALAVLTLLLAWQNRSLKAELAAARGAPPPGSLAVGDTLDAAPMPKFPVIPAAALVDAKGAVKAVWFGVPTDAQVSELRAAVTG